MLNNEDAGGAAANDTGTENLYISTVPTNRVEAEIDVIIRQDKTRTRLSYGLIIIFATTVLGAGFAAILGEDSWENIKEFLQLILPVETALLGGIAGFYFSTQQSSITTQSSSPQAPP